MQTQLVDKYMQISFQMTHIKTYQSPVNMGRGKTIRVGKRSKVVLINWMLLLRLPWSYVIASAHLSVFVD